jgi:hypothetical protein
MSDLVNECIQDLNLVKGKLQRAGIQELVHTINGTIQEFKEYKSSRKFKSSISPDDITSPREL